MTSEAFQVDLRGIVDLLARHLYSSPRVYLRELLQNGVDAIIARRELGEPGPERVLLRPLPDGGLEVIDTGIGLTAPDARELLATIGRSSKRDLELGGGREEFLGQFGIGLLSAFMVADTIDLVSRSARPDAPEGAVRWRGFADGRYELVELSVDDPALSPLNGAPGSIVRLTPRRDMEHWLASGTVAALAQDFGSLLPVDVSIEVELSDGSTAQRRLTGEELPWRMTYPNPLSRTEALSRYAEQALGFTPLAAIDLEIPIAGLSGVAYVLPAAVAPTTESQHRVYLKQMLLGTNVAQVMPPWAFFVRCVVNSTVLRPTASREGLYEDEVLIATRDALGAQIRRWAIDLLGGRGGRVARTFIEIHHLALRALALADDEILDLVIDTLPFESTAGIATLRALSESTSGRVLYTRSVEDFRRIAPVAGARGVVVVNGGYVYDCDLLERAAARHPELKLVAATGEDVVHVLDELEPMRELEIVDAVAAVRAALDDQDCDVLVRRYDPVEVSAILLDDRDAEHARQAQATAKETDTIWGQVLAELSGPARPRQLILNDASPTVQALLATSDGQVRIAAAHSLYVTATLASGQALGAREASLMNDSLSLLIHRALDGSPSTPPKDLE